jgi:hypothetical protein
MGRNGDKVSINPEAYTLEEGKLYLFIKLPLLIPERSGSKTMKNSSPKRTRIGLNSLRVTNP